MDDTRAPLPLIQAFDGYVPEIGERVFVAPNATIVGNVVLEADVTIWYSAVLRGDIEKIVVGSRSTIQDLCTLHTKKNGPGVRIGPDVSIGHNSVVHGATIGDGVFIGNACLIMDGAEIGAQTVVAAGSLVARDTKIPGGVMVRGRPAQVARKLTDAERGMGASTAQFQIQLANKVRGIHREDESG
jgi:carbonic anhydrase/acetyltransferase-like protein (isoleucine patch superfamily)